MELEKIRNAGLSSLIQHSHAMLERAEAGDWETVIKDEIKRRELINSFFSRPSNIASEPEISTAIQELLQINDELEKLTLDARSAVKNDIDTISKGRKAVSVYTDHVG